MIVVVAVLGAALVLLRVMYGISLKPVVLFALVFWISLFAYCSR